MTDGISEGKDLVDAETKYKCLKIKDLVDADRMPKPNTNDKGHNSHTPIYQLKSLTGDGQVPRWLSSV